MNFIAIFTILALSLKALFTRTLMIGDMELMGYAAEVSLLLLIILGLSLFCGRARTILMFGLNLLLSFIFLSAIMYFDFYNSIITYKSLGQAGQIGEVRDAVIALLHWKYLLFFADFVLYPFLSRSSFKISLTKTAMVLMLVPAGVFIGIGAYNASQTFSETSQYNQIGLLGYQLVAGISGLNALQLAEGGITPELIEEKRPSALKETISYTGAAKDKHLIILQLESVQSFLLNRKINGVEVTPNLNKFLAESFYFPHFYTQVGKGNTSDAEFITNTSLYALGDVPMSSVVTGKEIRSFPALLGKNGYRTATFHANAVSFWNRQAMYVTLGFDEYYDKKYFGTQDVISYGTSDAVFYQKSLDKLVEFDGRGSRFYANLIALSSHFPFDLPEEKKALAIDLPEEYNGSIVGSYIEAVSYADYAFGKLVEGLKEQGLYEKTVIAVYGDHQGLQTKNEADQKLVEDLFGREYHSVLDHLNVPLAIRVPGLEGGQTVKITGGLLDIYPTLANLLGLDLKKEIVFGTDLLNAKQNRIGIRFYAPTGTYVNNKYAFTPGETKGSGQITNIDSRNRTAADDAAIQQLEEIMEFMSLSDEYVKSLE